MTEEEIRRGWKDFGEKQFNILYGEVIDLAVKIKIFAIIAENKLIVHSAF